MARQTVDLFSTEQLPEGDVNALSDFVQRLRADFDSHNHDGSSSRQLDNIVARTISVQSAIIGGYKLYEAIVALQGGDFKSVAAALLAGKTRIFVRNGTYTSEPRWQLSTANTTIIGESRDGVDITFAQDTVSVGSERCINIGANNITVSTMSLRSYVAAAQDLFRLPSNTNFLAFNLKLQNTRGAVFHGVTTGYMGRIQNCFFDYSTISDTTNAKAFYALDNFMVSNCTVNITSSSSGWKLVDTCSNSIFTQMDIESTDASATFDIYNSGTTVFSSSYFYMRSLTLESNFEACILKNNGNAPASYFLDTNAFATRVNNCRIILDKTYNVINIDSANTQFMGNYIEGGKLITIDNASVTIRGVQVSNNNWNSAYTVAAMAINIGTNAVSTLIWGNVIRNTTGSFGPAINDSGTSTIGDGTTNQLITG